MGKGGKDAPFQNFMGHKFFHPANFWNRQRVWKAEEKQRQQEARQKALQYEQQKEQSIYEAKSFALLSKEDSAVERQRHVLSFPLPPLLCAWASTMLLRRRLWLWAVCAPLSLTEPTSPGCPTES